MSMSEWVLVIMDRLGLMGVLLLMFLENVFPPIPSELIMSAAGFAAANGSMGLVAVIVAGTMGCVLGALVLYYLGTLFDQQRLLVLTAKYGKYVLIKPDDVINAQAWFDKYGKAVIFFGRMTPGIRSLISIPAGMARMPMLPFLLLTTAGSAIWTAFLAYAGFLLGANYTAIEQYIAPVSKGVLVVILIVGAVIAFRRIRSVFFK